jgi:hypothetical protein
MGLLSRLAGFFVQREPERPSVRQGVPGVNAVGGFLVSPERSPDLAWAPERFKTFNEMVLNNATVGGGVRLFLTTVGGVDWEFTPPGDSGTEGEELAKLVDDILGDMLLPWYRVVRNLALFKLYGFSVLERIAKRRDDGIIGYESIEKRPQFTIEQWDIDEDGLVAGFGQRQPIDGSVLYIPRSKCVYIVDDSITDMPDGVGLLRHIVEVWRQTRRFEQIEGWIYELDARGMPIGGAPLGELAALVGDGKLTAAQRDALIEPIRKIVKTHIKNPLLGLVLDTSVYRSKDAAESPSATRKYSLDLATGGGGEGAVSIDVALKRKAFEMARVLCTEHMLLGGDGKGSLALSAEKRDQFVEMVKSTLRELAWSIKHDVLYPLADMNGWDRALMPDPKPNVLQLANITSFVDTAVKMYNAGHYMPPDDKIWAQARKMIGAAEMQEIPDDIAGELQRNPALPPTDEPKEGEEVEDEEEEETPKPEAKPKDEEKRRARRRRRY